MVNFLLIPYFFMDLFTHDATFGAFQLPLDGPYIISKFHQGFVDALHAGVAPCRLHAFF